jgi:hypothetical protein
MAMQRKANSQIRRAMTYGKKADPERLAAIAAANQAPRVRVLPRDPDIRKYLKHEPTKIAFRAEGSIEWPLDKFTLRRIRDGDVTVETQDAEVPAAQTRGRASARE